HNGTVDHVIATFNDTLQSSTDTSVWHLSNVPSGGSLASVNTSGSTATLTLNEGAGAADTSVGSFTVSLDASATGIRDAAGNQSSFSAQAPSDQAAPARTAMTMLDNDHNGFVDRVALTFSENLDTYTAGNTPWTLANELGRASCRDVDVTCNSATLILTEESISLKTDGGSYNIALKP